MQASTASWRWPWQWDPSRAILQCWTPPPQLAVLAVHMLKSDGGAYYEGRETAVGSVTGTGRRLLVAAFSTGGACSSDTTLCQQGGSDVGVG